MQYPWTPIDDTADKQREREEQKERNDHCHQKNNQGVFSKKIKYIFSNALYCISVPHVHPAFDVLGDSKKTDIITLTLDIAG